MKDIDDDSPPCVHGNHPFACLAPECRRAAGADHDLGADHDRGWPGDPYQQMVALAGRFPSMRNVPGAHPTWDPAALVTWLNTSGAPTSGSRNAALFLLSIWNGDDWKKHGLRVRSEPKTNHRRIGRFDIRDAWSCWDNQHRAAALAWLTDPFWP